MRKMATLGMLIVVVMLSAGMRSWAQGDKEVVELRGILVKVSEVGVETTGWELRLMNQTNVGGRMTNSVEVEGDEHKFQRLENLRITIKGLVTHRQGNGKDRIVIKIQKIKE